MPATAAPSVALANRSVTVSWAQTSFSAGPAVEGYVVTRYSSAGVAQTVGSGCSGTVTAASCTEQSVPAGTWRYTVAAKHGNWRGAESAQSTSVTVSAASFAITSSTTVTALPRTIAGDLANFASGQTVTYRLDDPTTGTALSGSISPTPIPSSGSATASVTLPAGVANGAHTIYAIGSAGDVASATVTVAVPTTRTATTSAWDLRDASAGGGEVDATAQPAAADGRTLATGVWATTFGTRYVEFSQHDPLPTDLAVSGATLNFRFAAPAAGEEACVYFELRRISTNEVLGTYGSAATPARCVTGTTLQTVSTSLPQVTTSAIANDLRIRVYARESAAKAITIDLVTVTGTAASTAFTLHTTTYVDATTATPTTNRWGPAVSGDASAYTSAANWATSFATTRYLKHTFGAYVPASASVTGATLKNQYRAASSGRTVCWYFELYSGTTLVKAYGSASAPVSCNSTASYSTDAVNLPELNTVARANSAVIRSYYSVSGSGTRTTQHDLVSLAVTYTE